MLTLEDSATTGVRSPFQQSRPSFLSTSQGVDLHTRQQTHWHVGPQGMTLHSQIQFAMARGSLFQLQVRLPDDRAWHMAPPTVSPPEMLQAWSRMGRLLTVDLRSGVTPRTPVPVKLSLELRSLWDSPNSPGSAFLDFPVLEPFHAAVREGSFHIYVDPIFQASILRHSVPAVSSFLGDAGETPALFSFRFGIRPRTEKISSRPLAASFGSCRPPTSCKRLAKRQCCWAPAGRRRERASTWSRLWAAWSSVISSSLTAGKLTGRFASKILPAERCRPTVADRRKASLFAWLGE